MKSRHDDRFENDPSPSREIARRYHEAIANDDNSTSLAVLHYRGGEEEFRLGQEYCASTDPGQRATGADILAQLGWGDQNFREESIQILTPLLDDPNLDVVCCAAYALGHRRAESAIPALVRRARHADPKVRLAIVSGLSGQEDPRAVAALIQLAVDRDRDVRDWAVFGLGTQIDFDSPELRDALRCALLDPDHEIRGEALVGLAKRKDPEIRQELILEWNHDDVSLLSIEAAEMTRDPRLQWHLKQFAETMSLEDDPYFAGKLAKAIAACESGPETSEPVSQ
jgi:HEAT repeat protein